MKFVFWVIAMTIGFTCGLFLVTAVFGFPLPTSDMVAGAFGGFIASITTMPNRKQEGK